MLYNLVPCNGVLPKGNFFNLNILGLDFTEKQIFDFRLNKNVTESKYIHENRYEKPLKKVGFISRDFSENRPSGQLSKEFFSYIREELKKYEIDLYLYSFRNKTSNSFKSYTSFLRAHNNIFNIANMIYEDKIDILIDMQGHMHTNFNKLLELKPAPVIVHWLGYPGTMGLKSVDYHIADKIVIPDDSTDFYREKIAYLNHCYQINNSSLLVEKSKYTREDLQYPNDKFIFCNFNDDYKLDKNTWKIWLEILKKTENSVMLLYTRSNSFRELLMADAQSYGLDSSKFIIAKRLNRIDHFNRLAVVDCGLDPYYCNGHTTSSDLICAGTPVVTYPGNTYQSRVTKSILLSMDLKELIADSWDDFIQKSIKLASDKNYHSTIKQKILDNRKKILFNSKKYTENFVYLLHNIWRNHFGTDLPITVNEMEVTEFGNHQTDKNYKWKRIKNKTINEEPFESVNLRYQELRDYADYDLNCTAFTTDGKIIKNKIILENTLKNIDNVDVYIKIYY
jgi:protein O-GlcNAc transferase